MPRERISWMPLIVSFVFVAVCSVFVMPRKSEALPQFARRYNLKCSACHTIVPVLNEQGILFQRLGYHLPPSLPPGQVAPRFSETHEGGDWTLANNVSVAVADFGYSAERTTQEGTSPSSTSAFQVNSWNNYFAGWLPDTNFFYHAELDIVSGGSTNVDLSNACIGYVGGTPRSSWFVVGGREHLQVAQGTRAAQIYSLLPNSPLLFENTSPTNFVFDQSPVGVHAGYTWISSSYKRVFDISMKVTNGDNADGSEILGPSSRNSKDLWVDVDFWYAPESGVTLLNYYGKKDNLAGDGVTTFHPTIRRQGVFANYMLKYKVDLLGGYLHSNDDWLAAAGAPPSNFIGNDYYGAVDYYIKQGFAVSGRYDLLRQKITGTSGVNLHGTHDWAVGANKTLTPSGNVVARIAYSYLSGREPVGAVKNTDKLFQADLAFNF